MKQILLHHSSEFVYSVIAFSIIIPLMMYSGLTVTMGIPIMLTKEWDPNMAIGVSIFMIYPFLSGLIRIRDYKKRPAILINEEVIKYNPFFWGLSTKSYIWKDIQKLNIKEVDHPKDKFFIFEIFINGKMTKHRVFAQEGFKHLKIMCPKILSEENQNKITLIDYPK